MSLANKDKYKNIVLQNAIQKVHYLSKTVNAFEKKIVFHKCEEFRLRTPIFGPNSLGTYRIIRFHFKMDKIRTRSHCSSSWICITITLT